MSNKHEALKLLAAGGTLTNADIYNGLANCDTASAVVVMMSWLKKDGLVEVAGKTGKQNQWSITDAGKKALEELETSGGGATVTRKKAVARRRKLPRKVKSVKPRKKYKKRAKKSRSRILVKAETTYGTRPSRASSNILRSRWAVTEDGAFVDLAAPGSDEIDAGRARSLVVFIRKLDEARA